MQPEFIPYIVVTAWFASVFTAMMFFIKSLAYEALS
jgi:hypothetical protein